MLLAETVLCLAGLGCAVELPVLNTSVFVGNSGTRLTVRNIGVGKHSSAEETRLLNPPELASPRPGIHFRQIEIAPSVLPGLPVA